LLWKTRIGKVYRTVRACPTRELLRSLKMEKEVGLYGKTDFKYQSDRSAAACIGESSPSRSENGAASY